MTDSNEGTSGITRKKRKYIILTITVLIVIFIGITGSGIIKSVNPGNNSDVPEFNYKIISPSFPDSISFAGEKVPLDNFEVAERIDRELLVNVYWHSSTILGIKRANRWFPVIDTILKKYNIPEDFKYVPLIESNLSNTVSPAGAVGFWQITSDVAKKYGLAINDEVDERYNVEKSTEVACKYFQDAYDKFQTWTMAAAAYNMGMNGIQKQIDRQRVHNYYNLLLGEETSRYIARILVMKEIYMHQEKYGFYIHKSTLYPELKVYMIKINSSVRNWTDFAFDHDLTYKILKYYNPWLRDTSLTDKNSKVYYLKMPLKGEIVPVKEK